MAKYKVIKSDPAGNLFEGQTIAPYYEDSKELIIAGNRSMDFHITKNSDYFRNHLQEVK